MLEFEPSALRSKAYKRTFLRDLSPFLALFCFYILAPVLNPKLHMVLEMVNFQIAMDLACLKTSYDLL